MRDVQATKDEMLRAHRAAREADAPRVAAFTAAIQDGRLDEARALMTDLEWAHYERFIRGAWSRADQEHLDAVRAAETAKRSRARAELVRRAVDDGDEKAAEVLVELELAEKAAADAAAKERLRVEAERLAALHAEVSTEDLAILLSGVPATP